MKPIVEGLFGGCTTGGGSDFGDQFRVAQAASFSTLQQEETGGNTGLGSALNE
jgi:hypothetical protein